jgi:hypothetical protein|tara:strand:+ start:1258 stop:1656 length:399 start_codon:yes stop_codon:yes gene_type:complete
MIIYTKHIPVPIEKVILGKNKKSTYYLTANLFYSTVHHQVRRQVVDRAKEFLKPFLEDCPKLGKDLSISIGYQHDKKSHFDLDNKAFFWQKVLLDLLKRMGKIEDDSVKYIQQIHYFYQEGKPKLILQVNKL